MTCVQVAYLMADISNVNLHEIKDLYENLEGLSCESGPATHAAVSNIGVDTSQLGS